MSARALLRAIPIALALLPVGALSASADDGRPPIAPEEAGHPPARVPRSELRAIEIASGTRRLAPDATTPSTKKLVILVGGYGSWQSDEGFDVLIGDLRRAPNLEIRRFGADSEYPYRTYGSLDANADSLMAEVRAIGPGYSEVHLVGHSMGGVVIDRALQRGLSAKDGVATFQAISSPHSGSLFARIASILLPRFYAREHVAALLALFLNQMPDTPAARDIAWFRAGPPPPGIVRVDYRLANDLVVNPLDARDGDVADRLWLPFSPAEREGHGGSLRSFAVRKSIGYTIGNYRAPAETPPSTAIGAAFMNVQFLLLCVALLVGLVLACCAFEFWARLPPCRPLIERTRPLARRYLASRMP